MSLTLLLASGIGVYGSLFAQPAQKPNINPLVNWNQSGAPAVAAKTAVVCGMTLVPANPKTDPAMKRTAPDAKRFPITAQPPSICKR